MQLHEVCVIALVFEGTSNIKQQQTTCFHIVLNFFFLTIKIIVGTSCSNFLSLPL